MKIFLSVSKTLKKPLEKEGKEGEKEGKEKERNPKISIKRKMECFFFLVPTT